jgi:hypothetical protein
VADRVSRSPEAVFLSNSVWIEKIPKLRVAFRFLSFTLRGSLRFKLFLRAVFFKDFQTCNSIHLTSQIVKALVAVWLAAYVRQVKFLPPFMVRVMLVRSPLLRLIFAT